MSLEFLSAFILSSSVNPFIGCQSTFFGNNLSAVLFLVQTVLRFLDFKKY